MKKWIILGILAIYAVAWAANTKTTGLTELATTPASTDVLYIVDDPGGTPVSKKITVANLHGGYQTTLTNEAGLYAALSDVTDFVQPGDAAHDGFSDFVAAEHYDWTSDQGANNVHANNLPTTGTWDASGLTLTLPFESETREIIFAEPDQLQPISDAWPLLHFPAEKYPNGVTIEAIHIQTSATCTDALNFEEWAQGGTTATSTVEAITLSGTHTEDDGTLTDATIAADANLYVDLPATPTDIAFYLITVVWKGVGS